MRKNRRTPTLKRERGLTLGEMLVVLAVFLIMGTMFILSSQFAIVKSKTARVVHDQQEMVKALYQYTADHQEVPRENDGLSALLRSPRGNRYLTTLPQDPFAEAVENQPSQFKYYADIAPQYESLVVSVGPDGDLDVATVIDERRREQVGLAGSRARHLVFKTPEEAQAFIDRYSYDPTNGSVSDGDIIQHFGYSGR
jgi:type II secretory pathway pseudopilin PulG